MRVLLVVDSEKDGFDVLGLTVFPLWDGLPSFLMKALEEKKGEERGNVLIEGA